MNALKHWENGWIRSENWTKVPKKQLLLEYTIPCHWGVQLVRGTVFTLSATPTFIGDTRAPLKKDKYTVVLSGKIVVGRLGRSSSSFLPITALSPANRNASQRSAHRLDSSTLDPIQVIRRRSLMSGRSAVVRCVGRYHQGGGGGGSIRQPAGAPTATAAAP